MPNYVSSQALVHPENCPFQTLIKIRLSMPGILSRRAHVVNCQTGIRHTISCLVQLPGIIIIAECEIELSSQPSEYRRGRWVANELEQF
jgi:hypothetical protein